MINGMNIDISSRKSDPNDMIPISKLDKDFLETFRHREIIESRADI